MTIEHLHNSPGFWYVAGPYSADPEGLAKEHKRLTGWLWREGVHVFSPITHWHDIAKEEGLPTDAKSWEEYNMTMLRAATGVILLTLPGWGSSKGTAQELREAFDRKMDVWGMDPVTLGVQKLIAWDREGT